jgi:indolepyruvate ferredoxin oxidoreductase, beta subunit
MKYDVILAGVGGQGVLSMATIIARAAHAETWAVTQAEVHGMAQRGGAVVAHLRISRGPIASDLIPRGTADLILSLEPMEALRYVEYLAPGGAVVSSTNAFVNIPNYPESDTVLTRIRTAAPRTILVDAEAIAYEAGDVVASNAAMVGAAAGFLPLAPGSLETALETSFAAKGKRAVEICLKAFRAGRKAAA